MGRKLGYVSLIYPRQLVSMSRLMLLWAPGQVNQEFLTKDLTTMARVDPLIQALIHCESRLSAWLNESALNAELFRRDPLTAIRAANLGVDEGLLGELEEIVTGIAVKLKAG